MRKNKNAQAIRSAHKQGYRVKEDGSLWSPRGRAMSPTSGGNTPYLKFNVGIDGCTRGTAYVHRLAAYQKFGEKIFAPGVVVRHLNGNSLDNSPANIAIGTHSDNMQDRDPEERRATARKGLLPHRKLTPDQVLAAVRSRQSGEKYHKIASRFGVSPATIFQIVTGRNYSDITGIDAKAEP